MQRGLKIIIQLRLPDGTWRCRGFLGDGFATPALVQIIGVGQGGPFAEATERELAAVVGTLSGQPEHADMPCRGMGRSLDCHAHHVGSCHKLLVIVGDRQTPIPFDALVDDWNAKRLTDDSYQIIPALPTDSEVDKLLPTELQKLNVCFYEDISQHLVPCILARSGITPEDFRVFISYQREDSSALADQLFGMLSAAGFDVFLDRFRVPPGVPFQEYLAQELADKSMLLLLESPKVLASEWVKWEIAFAKRFNMGLLALHSPGSPEHPDVDSPRRRELDDYDSHNPKLITDTLSRKVVLWVRDIHNGALHERRNKLKQSFICEAKNKGVAVDSSAPQGYIKLQSAKEYRAWVTSRPPQFDDFHYTHAECVANSGATGLVMSPMPHEAALRQQKIEWLSRHSGIRFSDEGQLIQTVAKMVAGTL